VGLPQTLPGACRSRQLLLATSLFPHQRSCFHGETTLWPMVEMLFSSTSWLF
jgi:hypothetical protein